MAQRILQADVVSAEHALVNALKGVEEAAVFFPVPGAQEAAAKHGGQGKRNKTGNQNCRADGDRKLVQQPSEDAAQKSTGMNTAASESVMETMVKPTSFAPRNAASSTPSPISMCRTMFSSMTMASSTTKPTESVKAIRERLSSE